MTKRMAWLVIAAACGGGGDKGGGGGGSGSGSGVVAPGDAAAAHDDRSRDAVVRGVVAALSAGDTDRLMKLSDPVGFYTEVLDCSAAAKPTGDEADFRDPKLLLPKIAKTTERFVAAIKGTKLEVVAIGAPTPESTKFDKGAEMVGCKIKTAWRVEMAEVKIKVTEPGREPWTDTTSMLLLAIGDRFYGQPPMVRTKPMVFTAAEMARDDMCACKDKACTDKLRGTSAAAMLGGAHDPGTDDDKAKAKAIDDATVACQHTARGEITMAELAAKFTEQTDRMCACKDKACADRLTQEMAADHHVAIPSADPAAALKKLELLQKRFDGCAAKVSRR